MTETPTRPREANHSRLWKAVQKAQKGQAVNFCPFGCPDEDLDEQGYCKHLIGFSNDQKTYEPLVYCEKADQRLVRVERAPLVVDGKPVKGKTVPKLELIPEGAKLERITTSYRVYHDRKAK